MHVRRKLAIFGAALLVSSPVLTACGGDEHGVVLTFYTAADGAA